jgi:nucleotide-binding universal stress UspA family protein
MKILIAFDGSDCSGAALDDLVRAGLPENGEAVVLSVAEVWLPAPGSNNGTGVHLDAESEQMIQRHIEKGKKAVTEAETLANHAMQRVKKLLPKWKVTAEATYGSPAWEIITRSIDLRADLIVVGSHGRSGIKRFFLGSISQKVLTEANCSVRIARGRVEVDPAPARLLIGFDGSKGAEAAIDAVATRSWPEGSEARLVSATDPITPSAIGRFIPPVRDMIDDINAGEREWLLKLADKPLADLRWAGLPGSIYIRAGNPKHILEEEAEWWSADCIFVGATAFGSQVERFLLGSTAAAVAARAHCSVEVVRR